MVLSDTVGERVTAWRRLRGWNRERLAKACEALGMPELTPAVLTNIESGRRQQGARRRMVTVDELTVLAQALSVPMVLFLAPYPHRHQVEMWPGRTISTELAFDWLTNEAFVSFDKQSESPDENNDLVASMQFWNDATRPIQLLRTHHRLTNKLVNKSHQLIEAQDRATKQETKVQASRVEHARLRVENADEREKRLAEADLIVLRAQLSAETAHVQTLLREIRETERHIVAIREQMAEIGNLPLLPPEFGHLTDKTAADFADEITEDE